MPSRTRPTFTQTFRTLVSSSGMSLSDIAAALKAQGINTTIATLSYWKTGRTIPRRVSSIAVLEGIEHICGASPGTLTQYIDHKSNAKTATLRPDNTHNNTPDTLKELEALVNWDAEVQREVLIDTYHISSDFKSLTMDAIFLVRIPRSKNPTLHLSKYVTTNKVHFDDSLGESGITKLEGARIGAILNHPTSHAQTVRLDLPADSPASELHRVSWTDTPGHSETPMTRITRHFSWPLRFYTGRLIFEGTIPEKITWTFQYDDTKNGTSQREILTYPISPIDGVAEISIENVANGQCYFEWT